MTRTLLSALIVGTLAMILCAGIAPLTWTWPSARQVQADFHPFGD